ncbi:MAG: hypothetical protein DAHOPDDO_02664 [Ignavibacteriaceae bacterium]|nr:hypothetical protein [Ignavibacteriaceae bacterium]
MKKIMSLGFVLLLLTFMIIPDISSAQDKDNSSLLKSPPPAPYADVSKALNGALPDFVPGLGTLYVDTSKLPEGPFLAYDKSGNLIKIVFMIPLENLNSQNNYLNQAENVLNKIGNKKVDHVNFIYSGPHPGVSATHYHIELVLVSAAAEKEALGKDLY